MSSGNERAPDSAARAGGTLNSSFGRNSGGNEDGSNRGGGGGSAGRAVPRESLQSFLERTQAAQTCTRQDVSENLDHYEQFDDRFEFEDANAEEELKDELLEIIEEVDEGVAAAADLLAGIKHIQGLFTQLDEGEEAAGEPLEENLVRLITYGRERRASHPPRRLIQEIAPLAGQRTKKKIKAKVLRNAVSGAAGGASAGGSSKTWGSVIGQFFAGGRIEGPTPTEMAVFIHGSSTIENALNEKCDICDIPLRLRGNVWSYDHRMPVNWEVIALKTFLGYNTDYYQNEFENFLQYLGGPVCRKCNMSKGNAKAITCPDYRTTGFVSMAPNRETLFRLFSNRLINDAEIFNFVVSARRASDQGEMNNLVYYLLERILFHEALMSPLIEFIKNKVDYDSVNRRLIEIRTKQIAAEMAAELKEKQKGSVLSPKSKNEIRAKAALNAVRESSIVPYVVKTKLSLKNFHDRNDKLPPIQFFNPKTIGVLPLGLNLEEAAQIWAQRTEPFKNTPEDQRQRNEAVKAAEAEVRRILGPSGGSGSEGGGGGSRGAGGGGGAGGEGGRGGPRGAGGGGGAGGGSGGGPRGAGGGAGGEGGGGAGGEGGGGGPRGAGGGGSGPRGPRNAGSRGAGGEGGGGEAAASSSSSAFNAGVGGERSSPSGLTLGFGGIRANSRGAGSSPSFVAAAGGSSPSFVAPAGGLSPSLRPASRGAGGVRPRVNSFAGEFTNVPLAFAVAGPRPGSGTRGGRFRKSPITKFRGVRPNVAEAAEAEGAGDEAAGNNGEERSRRRLRTFRRKQIRKRTRKNLRSR